MVGSVVRHDGAADEAEAVPDDLRVVARRYIRWIVGLMQELVTDW